MKRMKRRGLFRATRVATGDTRPPMLRLLVDGQLPDGMVAVNYHEQWRTLSKAQRLGYLDGSQRITEKGRDFIAKSKGGAA